MIDADLLLRIRNDLPMPVTIAALGRDGLPSKRSEGYFRFLCQVQPLGCQRLAEKAIC
jgi:hypothetical protein